MILLLAVLWLWDPVVTDCKGGPEAVQYYEMEQSTALPIDGICATGETVFWCGGYEWTPWAIVAGSPTTSLEYDPPVPCLGGAVLNRIVAVDGAGNRSVDPCP